MRRAPLLPLVLLALALTGCALPGWVPLVGKKDAKASAPPRRTVTPGSELLPAPVVGEPVTKAVPPTAETIADRIVAVVNNDAITLAELQESVVMYRHETRAQPATATDEELTRQFLNRLIESRLQLHEAEREKIVVEDGELAEELTERYKKFGSKSLDEFEQALRAQGLSVEVIKRRLKESMRVSKLVRRKVTLRVSVTEQEIAQYLDTNRAKLETGLSYHARHILIQPEGDSDAAWESARIKADLMLKQLQEGADFAELARQNSKDATARDGGDLGTLKRGELAEEIEGVILALAPGEVSRPHRSSLGYHLFRLESKETLDGERLTRARQQIRDILFREKYDARLAAWITEMKQRAIIEVRL
jgi:peptidyl-prolyl cis-trans isomerase SurA